MGLSNLSGYVLMVLLYSVLSSYVRIKWLSSDYPVSKQSGVDCNKLNCSRCSLWLNYPPYGEITFNIDIQCTGKNNFWHLSFFNHYFSNHCAFFHNNLPWLQLNLNWMNENEFSFSNWDRSKIFNLHYWVFNVQCWVSTVQQTIIKHKCFECAR